MCKSIVKVISLILIPILIVSCVLVGYDRYLDEQINKEYNSALGREFNINEINKGVKLLTNNIEKGDLILMGSSELGYAKYIPQHPIYMFPNTQLNSEVNLIGRAFVQSLLHAIKIGAISNNNSDQKIVLFVSPQWALEKTGPEGYRANFSEIQFYEMMNNKAISKDVKNYICQKTTERLARNTSFERPSVYAYLYSNNTFFSKLALNILKPYFSIRTKFLRLKDKHDSYKIVQRFKNEPSRDIVDIDWEQEKIKAQEMGAQKCSDNQFYINNYIYDEFIFPQLDKRKGCNTNANLLDSEEIKDYEVFLKICKDLGIKPYIICLPTNGWYYDYTGLTQDKRIEFYDKIRDMTSEYGFDYLDMRDKEYEPYFLYDTAHLGWKGWVYVNKKIAEHYS